MTREETKNIIENRGIKGYCEPNRLEDAFDAAIKVIDDFEALNAINLDLASENEDLVERIGKLIGYIDFLRNTAQGKKKSLNLLEKVVKAELEEIRAEGENFVKPRTGEWIPVGERLPEESDDYLVTNDDGVVEMAYFAHPKDYAISKGAWREIWCEDDVIAWMPLPQPYKAESEET